MQCKYEAIKNIILKHIPDTGVYESPIKGVNFALRNKPTDFCKCFYNPACIFVLGGEKQMIYGSSQMIYKKGQYVVSCADIPVSSKVLRASVEDPFIAIILELESNLISNLILETKLSRNIDSNEKCLAVADVDGELVDVFYRLVQLMEKPASEIEIMSSIIIKEIYYRLLTGPLGNQLCLINTKGTRSNQIASAISLLREKYRERLNIEDLAMRVNMAPSSFYRNFKKVTQVSPLQYQKQLRLYEAQRLMLTGDHTAETASYIVGYESPTQFSREYKKMFGAPPKTNIKKLAV